jgi:hypothetical protein
MASRPCANSATSPANGGARPATSDRCPVLSSETAYCHDAVKIVQCNRQRSREQIALLNADKSVTAAEKKYYLAQLEDGLKNAKPVQFKGNIALVLKYFDKLPALM